MGLSNRVLVQKLHYVEKLMQDENYCNPAEPDVLRGMACLYRNLMDGPSRDDIIEKDEQKPVAWKEPKVEPRQYHPACQSQKLRLVSHVRQGNYGGDSHL